MIQDKLSFAVSRKKYYKDSPERARQRARHWRMSHPERCAIYAQRRKEKMILGYYITPLHGEETEVKNHAKQWVFNKERSTQEVEQQQSRGTENGH